MSGGDGADDDPSESTVTHNEWIDRYQITDNRGTYRTREQVIKTAANELRLHLVANPTAVARRWVDNDAWLRRHRGETAGSIGRCVANEHEVVMMWGSSLRPSAA